MFHVKQSREFICLEKILDLYFESKKTIIIEYFDLLIEYGKVINLFSKNNKGIIIKHIFDILTASRNLEISEEKIFDIGSGNGLPGIILAIIFPEKEFFLVERKERKSLFLKIAIQKLKLKNVKILGKSFRYNDLLEKSAIVMKAIKPTDIKKDLKILPYSVNIYYFSIYENDKEEEFLSYLLPVYNEKHCIKKINSFSI